MKKWTQGFIVIIIIFSLFSTPRLGSAQLSTVVKIDPDFILVDPGDTFSVGVVVENVQELYAFDIIVQFDPDVLAASQLTLGSFLAEGWTLIQAIDNVAGTVQFAMTQINPEPAKTGSGTLFTIDFTALDLGESDLEFLRSDLSDNVDFQLIGNQPMDGFVQIGPAKDDFDLFIPLFIYGND